MKRRISILIVAFVLFAIPAWAIYQSSTFGNRSGIADSASITIGNLVDVGGSFVSGANSLRYFCVTAAETGSVDQVCLEHDGTLAVGEQVTVGIYTFSAGPANLIQDSAGTAGSGTAGYQCIDLDAAVEITATTQYCIAVGASDNYYFETDLGCDGDLGAVCGSRGHADSYTYSSGVLPASFGAFTEDDDSCEVGFGGQ